MQEKTKFVIELNPDNLEEITDIFKSLNIEFDTADNMISIPRDMIGEIIFTVETTWKKP